MRVSIVGGGLAGTLLAWRLAQASNIWVDLLAGVPEAPDATGASGGIVRAYETDPQQRALAIASLAELIASAILREWAGYYQVGSIYLRATGTGEISAAIGEIERYFPGSARLASVDELAGLGWSGLPDGSIGVVEQVAGAISPQRLRQSVLTDLVARPNVTVRAEQAGSLRDLLRDQDFVVLAAGAWTPGVLRAAGLPADRYRSKSIQYTVYQSGDWQPTAFVDDTTGLYGKPTSDGGVLLGVPTDEWDVAPGYAACTPGLHDLAAQWAGTRFPRLKLGPVRTRMNATDCYIDPPILRLRPVEATGGRLFTFTGGSGGAAKTALAASAAAAGELAGFPGGA